RALDFITVLPSVTWPSPATTTLPLRRTETMVVAWKTLGFWLGSMRPPGSNPVDGGRSRWTQPPPPLALWERPFVGVAMAAVDQRHPIAAMAAPTKAKTRASADQGFLRFARGCAAS